MRKKAKKSFDQHVVPREDGRWAVKREGAKKASKVMGMKHSAVTDAHHKAARHDATMYVHGRSGKITDGTNDEPTAFSSIIYSK
jgi:hypothetical protein